MPITLIQKFLKLESASSIILFAMAILAMVWANSPLAYLHKYFLNAFLFWINEVLMSVFFLLIGLELKRGFLEGQLSKISQVTLPAVGALGGMLIPALIYYTINPINPTVSGWAIPVATDIAFALGVLSLFGNRIPEALKLFLLALAIFDDLGAICIIAFLYSGSMSPLFLMMGGFLIVTICLLNFFSVRSTIPYLLVGAGIWFCLFHSGFHPTITGVIVALAIPGRAEDGYSPLDYLEEKVHPWAAYLIMPLFALANAGFSLQGLTWHSLFHPVVLGITLGLFVGKQIGVFSFSWVLIRLKCASLPDCSSWLELYGVSILCGIGFTMSLFLGTLAFQNDSTYLAEVRLGVIVGSILSGLLGSMVLAIAFARKRSSVVD